MDCDYPEIMKNVDIQNPELKELLEEIKQYVFSNLDNIKANVKLRSLEDIDSAAVLAPKLKRHNRDVFLNDEYLEQIRGLGENHLGFPEVLVGYNLVGTTDAFRFVDGKPTPEQSSWREEYRKKYAEFNNNLMSMLGVRHNALFTLYPPNEGFIAWHNNANASAYNLIFTLSENGDGWWKHWNMHKQEIETIHDVEGWQCKASYFGAYRELDPTSLVYHAASTNDSWRLTISYIFDRDNKDYWLDCIDEIEYGD